MSRPRGEPSAAAEVKRRTTRPVPRADVALIPRRFLPSLTALSAFESAARTGSITAAARELNLSQGAISRQISALERQLEVTMFHREHQRLRLTPAGHAYAHEIREGLKRIGTASMSLRANPAGGSLSLSVPPAFAAKWLVPALPRFQRQHPGVALNLLTHATKVAFESGGVDAAIHFGEQGWPEVEHLDLFSHAVIPVGSRAITERFVFREPADLRKAPLLHLTRWPDGWEQWLAHHGAPAGKVHGMLFDQLMTLAAACCAGLGLALLPPRLFGEELARGELVPALNLPFEARLRYRLLWPADRTGYPPLSAFRDWLGGELDCA